MDTNSEPLAFLGGRKFLFAMVSLIFAFALVLVGKMAVNDWVTFTEVMGTAYILGNVVTQGIAKM